MIGAVLGGAAGVYLFCLLGLFLVQRSIVFHPPADRADLTAAGAAGMLQEVEIESSDGLQLKSWWAPSKRPDGRVIIYFHGNAGHRGDRIPRVTSYLAEGYGILLVGYRGYGGNPGKPTEQGLYADARANLAFLKAQGVAPDRTILFGESLGTAVAVQMAIETKYRAVVLEAPIASVARSAAVRYPLLAFDAIVLDKFDSLSKIDRIGAPLLVIHGERDRVTLVKFGRMILAAAKEPKQGYFPPEAGHSDLIDHGMRERVSAFLAALPEASS
jgi:fermentation-respiration switch protein FrsA (DUF1100 family)